MIAENVPNAVTGEQHKFPVFADGSTDNVRTPADDLVFRTDVGVLLEGEVADGTAEGQVAVDPIQFDESAGVDYSSLLQRIPGLVVRTQRIRHTRYTGNASAVADVANIQVVPPKMRERKKRKG